MQFIKTQSDGLLVGWALTGPWVGTWVCYQVTEAGQLQLVRSLSAHEYARLHQQHIMYWGVNMGTALTQHEGVWVEAVLVKCQPASFAPTGNARDAADPLRRVGV